MSQIESAVLSTEEGQQILQQQQTPLPADAATDSASLSATTESTMEDEGLAAAEDNVEEFVDLDDTLIQVYIPYTQVGLVKHYVGECESCH